MHPYTATVIAVLCTTPVFILTGVAQQHFGIKSEVTAVLWMAGVTIGLIAYMIFNGRVAELFAVSNMWWAILIFSILIGSIGNVLLFGALANAHPGIVMAIFNTNALLSFILISVLAIYLPEYFQAGEFSLIKGGAIFMVVVGLGILLTQ